MDKPNPLETFLEENPKLRPITIDDASFSKHDEYHLVQLPQTIDVHHLLGCTINMNARTKLRINDEKYVMRPTFDAMDDLLVYAGDKLRRIQPASALTVQRSCKTAERKPLVFAAAERQQTPLPANLKERHPLFGADYHDAIVLDESIERKLRETCNNSSGTKKGKKKKKRSKLNESIVEKDEEEDDDCNDIFKILNDSGNKMQTKKKKQQKLELGKKKDSTDYDLFSSETMRNSNEMEMVSDHDLDLLNFTNATTTKQNKTKKKHKREDDEGDVFKNLSAHYFGDGNEVDLNKSELKSKKKIKKEKNDDSLKKKELIAQILESSGFVKTKKRKKPNGDDSSDLLQNEKKIKKVKREQF